MLYRTMGNRRTVSALCLGAMNFGTTTSPETATAILDRFVAAGGTFIDTANNYNHRDGDGGESEELLGRWMNSRSNRDQLVIATKCGARTTTPGDPDDANWEGLGRRPSTRPSRAVSPGWASTASTCITRTSTTAPPRWRRPSARSGDSPPRASSTWSAAAISPAGGWSARGGWPPIRASNRIRSFSSGTHICGQNRCGRAGSNVSAARISGTSGSSTSIISTSIGT